MDGDLPVKLVIAGLQAPVEPQAETVVTDIPAHQVLSEISGHREGPDPQDPMEDQDKKEPAGPLPPVPKVLAATPDSLDHKAIAETTEPLDNQGNKVPQDLPVMQDPADDLVPEGHPEMKVRVFKDLFTLRFSISTFTGIPAANGEYCPCPTRSGVIPAPGASTTEVEASSSTAEEYGRTI